MTLRITARLEPVFPTMTYGWNVLVEIGTPGGWPGWQNWMFIWASGALDPIDCEATYSIPYYFSTIFNLQYCRRNPSVSCQLN